MTSCSTVIVKFKERSEPRQEIRAAQESGATKLQVSRDATYISVVYLTEKGLPVKEIHFHVNDVKEYACEGVFKEFVPNTRINYNPPCNHEGCYSLPRCKEKEVK